MSTKPLGHKSYGHIPHLLSSRLGAGDHYISKKQSDIATVRARNNNDRIIVSTKLDGSNVSVAKINNLIVPLTRAGYRAETSNYEQHHMFGDWVMNPKNYLKFNSMLNNGERLCGEWLAQAHGTKYNLRHEPFVAFDLMVNMDRLLYEELMYRCNKYEIVMPQLLHNEIGQACSVELALSKQDPAYHGELDPVEGAVWKVEHNKVIDKVGTRKWLVNFLCKYVRHDKIDGKYMKDNIWNWRK